MKKYFIVIAALGFLVYIQSLLNGFVWDDFDQVVNNTDLFRLTNPLNIFFYHFLYYKPLFYISVNLILSFFGANAFIFHLFQLILHIINSCLVLVLFSHFFKKRISFALAIIFLVHPGISEAVLFISSIQDTLFLFFGLIATLLLIDEIKIKYIWPIYLFILLSIFSKETGLAFLFIALSYKILLDRTNLRIHLVYMAILTIAYAFLRFFVVGFQQLADPQWLYNFGLYARVINIPLVIAKYLLLFIFPFKLQTFQLHWYSGLSFNSFYLPAIILLGLLGIYSYYLFKLRKKEPQIFRFGLFFLTWLLIGFAFHLNILRLDMVFAERWLYFPIIGLLGMIGITLDRNINTKQRERLFFIFFVFIVVVFSTKTFLRSFDWQDEVTLFTHDYKVDDTNLGGQMNLGLYYTYHGKHAEAERIFSKANVEYPNNENVLVATATNYWIAGNRKKSLEILNSINYRTVGGRLFYAYYLDQQNVVKAKKFIADSIKIYPNSDDLILFGAENAAKLGDEPLMFKYIEMAKKSPSYIQYKPTYDQLLKSQIPTNTLDLRGN